MAYGTLKVDNITYTSGGSDASTSVSGIVALAAGNFNNVTATGTISGVTVTGVTANFQSGVFTTQVSGATVVGPTHTGTTANFSSGVFTTQISGATITGNIGQFTNLTGIAAGFTSVTGTANIIMAAAQGAQISQGDLAAVRVKVDAALREQSIRQT